jgi:hypothetical protein
MHIYGNEFEINFDENRLQSENIRVLNIPESMQLNLYEVTFCIESVISYTEYRDLKFILHKFLSVVE